MQCTTNLMRDIMELFCAGDVDMPTRLLALANNYGFNKWLYPECRPLILVKTPIICVSYPPTIFR